MSTSKTSPFARRLASRVRSFEKANESKAHAHLWDIFLILAAGGELPAVQRLLASPAASNAQLSNDPLAMALCGEPPPLLSQRTKVRHKQFRDRMLGDAYATERPTTDEWTSRPPNDPWRIVNQWRRIQSIAAEETERAERDALARLIAYLDELEPTARGAGYGNELVLALDLAYRHGMAALIPEWLERHGYRLESEPFLLETMLSFPSLAAAAANGAFRELMALPVEQIESTLVTVETGRRTAPSAERHVGNALRPATFADFRWWTEKFDWWNDIGYCVTLISGLSASEVLTGLHARHIGQVRGVAALVEPSLDVWNQNGGATLLVGVADVDGWALMVEVNGYVGVTDQLIGSLSRGRTIVSHFRNVNAVDRFVLWRDGACRTAFAPLFPESRSGTEPDLLLDTMRAVGFNVDGQRDHGEFHHTEAAFALAQRTTEVHLSPANFENRTYLTGQIRMAAY